MSMNEERILYRKIEWNEEGGMLKVTFYPIGRAWNFSAENYSEIIMHIGASLIKINSGSGEITTARGLAAITDLHDRTRLIVEEVGEVQIPLI